MFSRPYRGRGFEKSTCLQHGFFILWRWVCPWFVFNFKIILKHKQTFYLTWIIFLLIKRKLISFDWTFYPTCWMKYWINVGGILGESLYRLYVSSDMLHPTCKSIHSFIWYQIKDGDGHAFASDNIRTCLFWWWKATPRQNARVDKAETSVGFFPKHSKETHCGGLIRI